MAKKPNAKEIFDKIAPYQGWAGVVFCIWGIWGIISAILTLGWLSHGAGWIIAWVILLVGSIVEAGVGFILGFALIDKYVLSKNPQTQAKGKELLAKLIPLQGTLGLVSIVLGIVYIVLTIMVVAAAATA
ncbi:MAG: hypothetical protein LBV12_06575 [Puniceicoccales bacterium]|nr:hypothetical protein [Puniceicoccales bacterium]